jgi:hypothetical protein
VDSFAGIPTHDFGRVQRFIPLVFTPREHGTGDRSPLSARRSGNWIASSGDWIPPLSRTVEASRLKALFSSWDRILLRLPEDEAAAQLIMVADSNRDPELRKQAF